MVTSLGPTVVTSLGTSGGKERPREMIVGNTPGSINFGVGDPYRPPSPTLMRVTILIVHPLVDPSSHGKGRLTSDMDVLSRHRTLHPATKLLCL